ncbi:hypothetical protein NDU88_000215 [Pleurodeles waltl]|uniref:Uncharacterized protein n=1 Tax=Pleurodeles waltl TaxID=8319 RepID=A0AAV7P0Q1_PLEWA|nr:hypothetical protein NDU88_000215 [Pleurodeles waltl]
MSGNTTESHIRQIAEVPVQAEQENRQPELCGAAHAQREDTARDRKRGPRPHASWVLTGGLRGPGEGDPPPAGPSSEAPHSAAQARAPQYY